MLVVFVERTEHELHLHAHLESRGIGARRELSEHDHLLGAELYQRLSVLGDHFSSVGKGLNNAVTAYNRAVGSLEGRVLVTARRFVEMGVVGASEKELAAPPSVDATTRALQSPELTPPMLDLPLMDSTVGAGPSRGT